MAKRVLVEVREELRDEKIGRLEACQKPLLAIGHIHHPKLEADPRMVLLQTTPARDRGKS